ncbi:MAG TPA: amidohydrolase family protein [Chloroflexota bacterium]|jgi:imidazolonepropionase-like amidohydrolase
MVASVVIRNVTIIDGTGAAPVAGADVVARDGVFAAVGPGAAAAEGIAGATVLEGAGQYLIPGLWESHTHLRAVRQDTEEATQAALDDALRLYLSRGVTTVVDLGGPAATYLRRRERYPVPGQAGGARLLFAGPNFTGINGWPFTLHHDPTCTNQAGDVATALAAFEGLLPVAPDVVKIMYEGEAGEDKLPREALEALVRAAHAHGLRTVVHVRSAEDSLHALQAGADGLEHSFLPTAGQTRAEAEALTETLVRAGAYLTPTLAIWEQLGRAGDRDYLDELAGERAITPAEAERLAAPATGWGRSEFPNHPKAECRARLEAAFEILPRMHAAGVKLAVGSDLALAVARPAATLREMALLARAGVPAGDVLVDATRHAAEKVGRGAEVGTIQPGKIADAVLLDADPLADLANLIRPGHVVATIKDGEVRQPA